ncbi:hypothetical protein C5614_14980 [Massilia phosphatilytica]|nr:hypothetical protein C5614_14980 [Massilia phosphatilytica]
MYQFALRQGVPMLAEWLPINQTDFDIDSRLREAYDCYLKEVGSFGGLGAGVNRHMALYYAWRFRSIKLKAKGDVTEAKLIRDQEDKFRKQDAAFTDELDRLAAKETLAKLSLDGLVHTQDMQTSSADGGVAQEEKTVSDADVETARKKYDHAHNEHLRAKARKDSLPDMKKFIENLDIYDRQLLADVQAIHAAVRNSAEGKKRSDLRPHYLALLTAYENEFQNDKGLKNEGVIRFFDNYVHDSLAGFGKDATLPSDPRVVYLGGNEKYWYAKLDMQNMVSDGDKMPV